ncbi:NAD(P)/FAD-dependent oxidoreductase, partial [Corynebacterium sp. HMSC077D03]|uniref:NAD(P)/FAD-dependent oxidoreductase n=1 Tax=Corynebacterium sp. HMSC077D03 TaxID=1739392 RepID=UPI000B2B00D5
LKRNKTWGTSQRSVAVVDSGKPRNRFSSHAHGIMGLDGVNPVEYLEKGQSEFRAFGGNYIKGTVAKLEPAEDGALGWRAITAEGDEIRAKHVLVSTGITDELPDVPGVEELWGQRIFHCPYCHGYEVRNRRIAVIGGLNPGFTVRMVHLLRKWSPNITFFPNGLSLGETDLKQFAARGIEVNNKPVQQVAADPDFSEGLILSVDGEKIRFESCFVGPAFHPNHQLLIEAGCQYDEDGWVQQSNGRTSQQNLWAAGNVTSSPDQVPQAMGAGAATAIAIDQAMLTAELSELV